MRLFDAGDSFDHPDKRLLQEEITPTDLEKFQGPEVRSVLSLLHGLFIPAPNGLELVAAVVVEVMHKACPWHFGGTAYNPVDVLPGMKVFGNNHLRLCLRDDQSRAKMCVGNLFHEHTIPLAMAGDKSGFRAYVFGRMVPTVEHKVTAKKAALNVHIVQGEALADALAAAECMSEILQSLA